MKNRELLNLLRYQKSLTYFRTGLESNRLMMRRLQSSQFFEAYPEDLDLLEDVLVETEQAVEMTRLSSDILMQSLDTFASIINNNLNDVMKLLAVATIILSVPTVMASLYGMNVALPGMDHPYTFWLILVAATLGGIALVMFFWRRDWL
jgi:magnesium transporter